MVIGEIVDSVMFTGGLSIDTEMITNSLSGTTYQDSIHYHDSPTITISIRLAKYQNHVQFYRLSAAEIIS